MVYISISKIVLDVANFTIYRVEDVLSITHFKIQFCPTGKELELSRLGRS